MSEPGELRRAIEDECPTCIDDALDQHERLAAVYAALVAAVDVAGDALYELADLVYDYADEVIARNIRGEVDLLRQALKGGSSTNNDRHAASGTLDQDEGE